MTSVLVINFTAEITDKRRDAGITSDSWSVHYTFGSRRGSQFQIFRIRRRQTTRFQYPSKQWNRKLSPTRIHPTCCSRKYSYLWEGVKRSSPVDSMDSSCSRNVQSSRSLSLLTPDLFPPEYYPGRGSLRQFA